MEKKANNSDKKRTFISIKTAMLVLLAVIMVTISVIGGLFSKFLFGNRSNDAQLSSPPFYFTVEVLGDSEMARSMENSYSYDDRQSGTWHLYGDKTHSIGIEIRNFYDDLRITEGEITYSITVSGVESSKVTDKDNQIVTNGSMGADGKASVPLTLEIPEGYEEGQEVTVKVVSQSPYVKMIELHFILHIGRQKLVYQLKDAYGSPYAELIIMNGMDTAQEITLDWKNSGLYIDNTN